MTTIDYNKTKKAALVLRAVNNPVRQRIITLLNEKGELPVTDIYVSLRASQSEISQHLSKLRAQKIVTHRRNGKQIIYGLNIQTLDNIATFTEALLK